MRTLTEPQKRRDATLRRTYGISIEEYWKILDHQDWKCPICLKQLEGHSNPVDHDHATGFVRGVTCNYCNRYVIGRNRDWEKIRRMSDYLRVPPASNIIGSRAVPKQSKRKRRAKRVS